MPLRGWSVMNCSSPLLLLLTGEMLVVFDLEMGFNLHPLLTLLAERRDFLILGYKAQTYLAKAVMHEL